MSFDFFLNADNIPIIGLIALLSYGFLLVLGLTNRVIVYNDGGDLALNFGIILIPLVSLMYVGIGAPPDDAGQLAKETYYSQNWIHVAFLGSMICSAFCVLGTTWISIRENGIILGAAVAALKILTAVFASLLIVFWFFSQDKKRKRSLWTNVLYFSVIGWFLSLLVNGDRVRTKRLSLPQ